MDDLYDTLVNDQRYLSSFSNTVVLGVTGTNGSGKDSMMNILSEHGFVVYNTGDHLRQIALASLGSINRGGNDSPSGRIGNAERVRFPGGMVELGLIDWWAHAGHLSDDLRPRGLVIGSIRGTGEVEQLKKVGGKLVVTDADRQVRYQRMLSRKRSDEVGLSFEQFCQNDDAELAVGETDPTKFGMDAVIKQADSVIYNDGSLEDFRRLMIEELKKIGVSL